MATIKPEQGVATRRPRSLLVRRAAAEAAIQAAKNQGKVPDPRLLKLVGRAS